MIGFNKRSFDRTWHRGATCPVAPSPCDISAAYSPSKDVNPVLGGILWIPKKTDSSPDVRGQSNGIVVNDTVLALENNWGVPLLFAGLSHTAEKLPYMRCLQGQGALLKHPVCKHKRPLPTRLGPDSQFETQRLAFKGLWNVRDSIVVAPPPPPVAPNDFGSASTIMNLGGTTQTNVAATTGGGLFGATTQTNTAPTTNNATPTLAAPSLGLTDPTSSVVSTAALSPSPTTLDSTLPSGTTLVGGTATTVPATVVAAPTTVAAPVAVTVVPVGAAQAPAPGALAANAPIIIPGAPAGAR